MSCWEWTYYLVGRCTCPTCNGARGDRGNGRWVKCPECGGKGVYEKEASFEDVLRDSPLIAELRADIEGMTNFP